MEDATVTGAPPMQKKSEYTSFSALLRLLPQPIRHQFARLERQRFRGKRNYLLIFTQKSRSWSPETRYTEFRRVLSRAARPLPWIKQTTIFGITARTPIVERTIAVLTVPVNESECQPSSFFVQALTSRIKQGIDQALQGRLHDPAGSKVTADVGVVFIAVTINLQGQDTMDISMQLVIQMDEAARNVAVTARSIVADAHISGLGSLCEGAVSQTAQAFMTEIANNQIVPTVVQGLNDQIQQTATAAKTADPQHRDFVLTSFTLNSTEVAFVICPTGTGGPS